MDSWVGLRFFFCRVVSIPKLKSVGLLGLPIGSHLGLVMVGAAPVLQATSIDPHSSSRPSTTPICPLKPWMDKSFLDWMNGESMQPSNIEHWISCENNLVDECPFGDRHSSA